ncbi:hypothetical protein llap_5752 [Limosa lapponica baueri]|uniref:Uncharacterized protein n=1 Tax=Limosa lapponica baueri TaxID=1758121 RepID=A0A2I0UD15_LIMLA|nr:hypothetical protein llap_5752 [Limosa lapponica baueri]
MSPKTLLSQAHNVDHSILDLISSDLRRVEGDNLHRHLSWFPEALQEWDHQQARAHKDLGGVAPTSLPTSTSRVGTLGRARRQLPLTGSSFVVKEEEEKPCSRFHTPFFAGIEAPTLPRVSQLTRLNQFNGVLTHQE